MVKDDGLAAGKGVVVTDDRDAALAHAEACLAREGGTVVVEEFLDGPEVSLFCVTDGHEVVPLAPAQDFKRLGDGDAGPNTGGMGAYSPLPWAPDGLVDEVVERVARPVVAEMARRGTPFSGLLYCGLALTSRGLRVIEFNARFGDPETQVVLARLATPLGVLLHAAATGHLAEAPDLRWHDDAAVTVVVAAHGYPGEVRSGDRDHRPRGGRRRRRACTSCTPAPGATARAAWWPAAGGCCRWSAPAPTSTPPAPRPTPGSPRSAWTARSTAPTSPPASPPDPSASGHHHVRPGAALVVTGRGAGLNLRRHPLRHSGDRDAEGEVP